MKNRRTIHIEWGDCDPAQIVYYPRYFEYFDNCTAALFAKAGFSKRQILKTYGIIGIPLVDVRSRFITPSHFSEDVVVESEITRWGTSSFCVRHQLLKDDVLAVECFETRVWAAVSAKDPNTIESRPIPPEVIEKFSEVPKARGKNRGLKRK
jgi:4-hydroxybenzoyl-CoA thioesterase